MMENTLDIKGENRYVHNMNAEKPSPFGTEPYRSLQILDELSNNDSLTQRDLSGRLGIALGLVNSYIKNLVKKGFITVKAIPSKRYAYYLTPKGFTEKTRLTYDLLHDYTRIYREARENLKTLFNKMQHDGIKKVVFAGADEIAEIAYISLQETTIELIAVVDGERSGEVFFSRTIQPLQAIDGMDYDSIVVTSYLKRKMIYEKLIQSKVDKKDIQIIFT
jgi:DNA-binding MarR family transcriptional regulator